MHNFNTTNVQSPSSLGVNMQIIDTAIDSVAYNVWVGANELDEAGDTDPSSFSYGSITTGSPQCWFLTDGSVSSVCAYLARNSGWKHGVVGVVPHYSSTVAGGSILWKVSVTPATNLSMTAPTSVTMLKDGPSSANGITTVTLNDNNISSYASIDSSHIGLFVCIGRNAADASDTNSGKVSLYGVTIVYRELRRMVGGK